MATFELTEADFDHELIASRIQRRLASVGIVSETHGGYVLIYDPCGTRWMLNATSSALIASDALCGPGSPADRFDRFQSDLLNMQRKSNDGGTP